MFFILLVENIIDVASRRSAGATANNVIVVIVMNIYY